MNGRIENPYDGIHGEPLVDVSAIDILLSMVPLAVIACISSILVLDIEWPIIISAFRTFVQLSVLAFILDPIFTRGEEEWWLVLGYCFLMILLASYEGSTRSKYYVDGQFWMVLFPMVVNVVSVALFAFFVVIKPEPRWDPQYVIPIVGMLLGNCINGISLSMNSLFTSMVENSREIELLLSFGANEHEATERLVRESIRNGTMPQLNSMAIIGLISIPGMMTGQILGGTSVTQAARYQILIIYFIAMCSFGTILMELRLAVRNCFDSRSTLRTEMFRKRKQKLSLFHLVGSFLKGMREKFTATPKITSYGLYANETTRLNAVGTLDVATPSEQGREKGKAAITVEGLSYCFRDGRDEESKQTEDWDEACTRVLFENVSFTLYPGEAGIITGPSGVGKSTLLRVIAGLAGCDGERIKVNGVSQSEVTKMPIWRRQVRYVPQTKIDIPGSPNELIRKIASLDTWKTESSGIPSHETIESETRQLVRTWGMSDDLVNSEWKTLSGGESQRMVLAIVLASLPEKCIILLDESTSALDLQTKIKVEKSIQEYCKELDSVAIWVSHDPDQKRRLSN